MHFKWMRGWSKAVCHTSCIGLHVRSCRSGAAADGGSGGVGRASRRRLVGFGVGGLSHWVTWNRKPVGENCVTLRCEV